MINLFELYKEGTFKAFEFVILISKYTHFMSC